MKIHQFRQRGSLEWTECEPNTERVLGQKLAKEFEFRTLCTEEPASFDIPIAYSLVQVMKMPALARYAACDEKGQPLCVIPLDLLKPLSKLGLGITDSEITEVCRPIELSGCMRMTDYEIAIARAVLNYMETK